MNVSVNRRSLLVVGVTLLLLALGLYGAASSPAGKPDDRPDGLVRGKIVDYAKPPWAGPGGGGHIADASSTSFRVGKVRWFGAPKTVTYDLNTSGCPASGSCDGAVNAGFDPWDASGITLNPATNASINLCTGQENSVSFQAIDGPGNVLAFTAPCYYLATGEMVGFDIVFDSGDSWCLSEASCLANEISLQATTTHEAGHVIGLGHVRSKWDIRLTMFPAIAPDDFGYATLGCGELLGINALYGTTLNCDGVPLD